MEKGQSHDYYNSLGDYGHVLVSQLHPQIIILVQQGILLLNVATTGVLVSIGNIITAVFDSKMAQGHQAFYSCSKLNTVYHHAEFQRFHVHV